MHLYILSYVYCLAFTSMASPPVNCSSSTAASCCCSSQLLDETVGAAEVASGAASRAPWLNGSSNIWARSEGSGCGAACSAGGAADGAARMGGSMCVALFSGAGSGSSEGSEEPWEYVEEVALAEENPARLAFSCPPRRSTNTAQRKPAGVLAGTAALAQVFDEIERPGQLFDEAVGAADRVAWAWPMGGVGVAGSCGWAHRLAETVGSMTGAAVMVLAGGEHGADMRAQN